jgi:long-chain acyl-CoA synthetase
LENGKLTYNSRKSDGTLSIIDRIKNLVKLSHGEYIALEKLEAQYKSVSFVQNIVIHADPFQSYIVAVVVPLKSDLECIATELKLECSQTFESLCANSEIVDHCLKLLENSAKNANFKGVEFIKKIRLVSDEWNAENGMLTAAQKIKRKEVVDKYQSSINMMYGK